jgi:hypothetical protein
MRRFEIKKGRVGTLTSLLQCANALFADANVCTVHRHLQTDFGRHSKEKGARYGNLRSGKENTPEGDVYFALYVFVLYFVLYLYFLAPATATRDRCGGRKRDGASCLGCTLALGYAQCLTLSSSM